MKTSYFFYSLIGILTIITITISIVIGLRLYQGLNPKTVAEGFKTATLTMYIIGLIITGGVLVGGSVFLTLQWSSQWSSKTKDQNNELISTMTEIIKRQEHILPPPQNFTLNLKNPEHKSLTLSPEEEQKEQQKLLHNNKNGIY